MPREEILAKLYELVERLEDESEHLPGLRISEGIDYDPIYLKGEVVGHVPYQYKFEVTWDL